MIESIRNFKLFNVFVSKIERTDQDLQNDINVQNFQRYESDIIMSINNSELSNRSKKQSASKIINKNRFIAEILTIFNDDVAIMIDFFISENEKTNRFTVNDIAFSDDTTLSNNVKKKTCRTGQ